MLAALAWGVMHEATRPRTWRRTVRTEFRRALRQAAGGGLVTVLVAAGLTGLALVSQTLYWFGIAGQEQLEGSLIVTVLVRELTPVLVGTVLLGRSGTATVTELGSMQVRGQVQTMIARGLDPFLLLVLPRTLAFALASFSLGVLFVLTALLVGFASGSVVGAVHGSLWLFLDHVTSAMQATDFALLPAKTLCIGALVALTACLTALTAREDDEAAHLPSVGFVRGVLAIMLTSSILSFAA
jgi:phospholipid/cholesterol/gamma-HCH transport system permease protein